MGKKIKNIKKGNYKTVQAKLPAKLPELSTLFLILYRQESVA